MQLPKEGDLHQGKENLVHFHLNCARSESLARQENSAQRHEKCKYLLVQGHASETRGPQCVEDCQERS